MSVLNPFMLCLPSPVAGEYSRVKLRNKRGKAPKGEAFRRGDLAESMVSGIYHDHIAGLTVTQIAARYGLGYYQVHRIVNKNSYAWFTDAIDYELKMLQLEQEGQANDAQR